MRVIVLVDGDNIAPSCASQIVTEARAYGAPQVLRAYADAARQPGWGSAEGFRVIHAGSGKNAADILLCLDAMEFLTDGSPSCFVLVTGDGDFSHLAVRLREKGQKVVGIAGQQASKLFRASCSAFIEVNAPSQTRLIAPSTQPCAKGSAQAKAPPAAKLAELTDMEHQVVALIAAQPNHSVALPHLNILWSKRESVQISQTVEKTWRKWLTARPKLFALDPRGPDACVRLVSATKIVA